MPPSGVLSSLTFPADQEELLSLLQSGTGDKPTKFSVTVIITFVFSDDIQLISATSLLPAKY